MTEDAGRRASWPSAACTPCSAPTPPPRRWASGRSRAGPGRAELAMTVTAAMLNGHQIGHGGVVFMLADTTFAVACNSYNRNTVATGCDIDFVAAVRAGDELRAVAVERFRRGRAGLYDVTVRRADGAVVAEMRGRCREIPGTLVPPAEPARQLRPPGRASPGRVSPGRVSPGRVSPGGQPCG